MVLYHTNFNTYRLKVAHSYGINKHDCVAFEKPGIIN